MQNSARLRPSDLQALRTFRTDYPECTALLLHRGDERALVDGVWCVPVEEFLRQLHPSRGLTAFLDERGARAGRGRKR